MGFHIHGVLGKFPSLQVLLCDFITICLNHVCVFLRPPLRKITAVSRLTRRSSDDFSPVQMSVIVAFECCYLHYLVSQHTYL